MCVCVCVCVCVCNALKSQRPSNNAFLFFLGCFQANSPWVLSKWAIRVTV